jgi:cellulose synthase/poly-beta-1,6-N-acetylglucosamine synthase-like glycosyltransferase/peptidoglycan/xylan/chitin deacetylase (PgdA/CDA1 family)/spore germination protein YaaH
VSDPSQSIFADPKGIRRRILQIVTVVGILSVLTAAGYFFAGLLILPQLNLPSVVRDFHARFRALPSTQHPPRDIKDNWRRIRAAGEIRKPGNQAIRGEKVVLGFVSGWDPASLLSLERHAGELTHVATDWFTLTGVESELHEEPEEKVRMLCVRKGIGFLPVLRNLDGDEWQPEAIESLANGSPGDRKAFFDRLVSRLPPGATGMLVEWSQLDPGNKAATSVLLRELSARLHAAGKQLWFSVPTGSDFDAFDMEAVAACCDRMVATLHGENSEGDDPGPVASNDWFQGWLSTMMAYGDPGQWVIGLGAYGYDWRKDAGSVEQIAFTDGMARAAAAGVDPASVNSLQDSPHFSYLGGPGQNQEHEVWFLDAVTLANELRLAAPFHPGGIALDRLGTEDPAVWEVLRRDPSKALDEAGLKTLSRISLEEQIASTGSGDFITVGEDAKPGERRLSDMNNDLTERFVRFPVPESITRQGDPGPHRVAITFDDGPDPKWTPRILQILKARNAPAAFFVLGTQAQHYPDLLERIVREGHEIGNHSYTHQNLAEAGDQQIELELNATTRLIEAETGRSTAFFRPPYNSDGTPAEPGELRALRVARDLGYLTVTQSIDPDDWEKPGADALLRRVKDQRAAGGSVILLHDGGGDRSQTAAALPAIIDYLRERGDEIVPLSKLIDLPAETVMPPLNEGNEPLAARYVYKAFSFLRFLETAAWTALLVVTLLALFRVLFHVACALRQRARERRTPPGADFHPPVSVLLAAYNEERVIASTIQHVLDSEYAGAIQIVVVDDGSGDGTAAAVEAIAASEPRVLFLRQPNGGKASALRRALSAAIHETVVMIDADTMVAPDGIRNLVAPLADEGVGAVSGHVRVGNTRRWLGRFQDLEYVTAFEIDRRAQDFLGCIIVAPGALSAFRRRALDDAGPITNDTLAEDTDLTLQLHRLGWEVVFAPRAYADTEAPESVKALLSQRFRWAFGTLQCLWKHGDLTFARGSGWLGWFALPSVWIFQIAVVAVTPVLDLMVLWSLWLGRGIAIWPYFVASLMLDAVLAAAGLRLADRAMRTAWLSVPMRLLYRPLLGYVVWKCILKALGGSWVRWSKLERTAAAIRQREGTPSP